MAPTRYMVTLVWFFLKCEMSGAAPNIGNVADAFKLSHSQLSQLITAKKLRSGLSRYVPKRRKVAVKGEPSPSEVKEGWDEMQEKDKLEGYLI